MSSVRFKASLVAWLTAVSLSLGGAVSSVRAACQLASGPIKHVVYIEFDNVHFTRDNPNVPSDMEQMPSLLNFIEQNGTLDTGDHAVLISHTANDILTTQTGIYSDRDGIAVANSFGVFGPVDPKLAPHGVWFPSSFFYWTDLVSDITPGTDDSLYAMLTETGQNVPAPWAPFTKAGCDVGAFSTANIVLERTPFDVVKVFGAGSTEAKDPLQTTNYIGESVHCALGSTICTAANGAVADLLPDEPGGYNNYQALFGGLFLNQAFGPLKDLDGNVLKDSKGNPGFPGFSPTATQTLGAVATMLERGVPVVFAYIADLHDNEAGGTFGPGQAGYVAQAAAYDKAFAAFFKRLTADGITPSNTLFVITPDEGDHFAGSAPTPANCDGVTTPCTYPNGLGELDINLALLASNAGNPTPFDIHFDDAPTVYVQGQPGPADPVVRGLERTMASLTATDPYAGKSVNLLAAMADEVEERMLHMVTADANRTPTFTFFGDPDFFFETVGSATPTPGPSFAWNHGDIQPEIGRTFIGIVGPGVANLGILGPGSVKGKTDSFFSDHTDVRPTIMELVGLQDGYVHDGRVITEVLNPKTMSKSLKSNSSLLAQLGQAYKQINAPFGQLAMDSLVVSTKALSGGTMADDHLYLEAENHIQDWIDERDSIVQDMKTMLDSAEFGNQSINASEAKALIKEAESLKAAVHMASIGM
jgi:hypothetical protein